MQIQPENTLAPRQHIVYNSIVHNLKCRYTISDKGVHMSIFDFTVTARDGSKVSLNEYAGKVLLIVNTATGCGFTPQYDDLEALYADCRDKGFEILDFPCNQFANQAPGTDEEIHSFCTLKFGTEFPQFAKLDVNGPAAEPLFVALATAAPFAGMTGPKKLFMAPVVKSVDKEFGDAAYIKWNFTKFLVDRAGNVVSRFEPTVDMKTVRAAVEELL